VLFAVFRVFPCCDIDRQIVRFKIVALPFCCGLLLTSSALILEPALIQTIMNLIPACLLIALAEPVLGFGVVFGQFNVRDIDLFKSFFPKDDGLTKKREELKADLLQECQGNDNRQRIEEIIAEMKEVSPTPESATSPLLQGKWVVEWTTEKEINLFIDWNISGDISQTVDGSVLESLIPFQKGGFLGVKGELSTDGGVRTDFEFTEATLDLGKWGSFKIPPVGKGWFDTVYLDNELRVDTNSRDDILICRPMNDSS
jgi:hypothetical protein